MFCESHPCPCQDGNGWMKITALEGSYQQPTSKSMGITCWFHGKNSRKMPSCCHAPSNCSPKHGEEHHLNQSVHSWISDIGCLVRNLQNPSTFCRSWIFWLSAARAACPGRALGKPSRLPVKKTNLLGGIPTPLEKIFLRQLGWLFPVYRKINHVLNILNHQPEMVMNDQNKGSIVYCSTFFLIKPSFLMMLLCSPLAWKNHLDRYIYVF